MNVFDYRLGKQRIDNQPIPGYFIGLGKDETILFEWANFDFSPRNPRDGAPKLEGWKGLLDRVEETSILALDATTIFRPYDGDDLIIDNSRNTFKWPAARSLYSAETCPILEALLQRNQVTPRTRVYFGNWALADGVLEGTIQEMMDRSMEELVLFHGTSTVRLRGIQQNGLKPCKAADRVWPRKRTAPEAVFLTPSLSRALYFTRHTAAHDQKKLRKAGKKFEEVGHVILRCTVPKDCGCLVADDDWRDYPHCDDPESWEKSLRVFGQVGLRQPIPAEELGRPVLQFRKATQLFHLGVTTA